MLLGHGTENDFVVLPDPDGDGLAGGPARRGLVRRLCDRRAGLGGDGVLRVVRSRHVPDAPAVLGDGLDACEWFMDHRNADGSHAEMCGNGIRLFLHVLVTEGLLDRAACRGRRPGRHPRRPAAGRRHAADGGYWVDMGPARPLRRAARPGSAGRALPGLGGVDGQPAPGRASPTSTVDALDLSVAPGVDPALFPEGSTSRWSTC